VRPNPTGETKWEIVDGEHRWKLAGEAYDNPALPYVNVGPISDAQAKTLTIRANALRGEFDAIKLAELVAEVSADMGRTAAELLLPYGSDRMQAMIDMARAGADFDPSLLSDSMAVESGVGGGAILAALLVAGHRPALYTVAAKAPTTA
jgi:hypothetical protein